VRRHDSPIVGREEELKAIDQALHEVGDRRGAPHHLIETPASAVAAAARSSRVPARARASSGACPRMATASVLPLRGW
jgi:hypothetical protein